VTDRGASGAWGRRKVGPLVSIVWLAGAAGVGLFVAQVAPTRAELGAWAAGARAPDLSAIDGPVRAAAAEFHLDPDLLRGLVATESSGDPRARSGAGAVGLIQLLPKTAAEHATALGLDPAAIDLTDPATNLRLGARHLRGLLDQFDGEEAFAIAAYNAGAERVKRWRLRAVDASPMDVIRREAFSETRAHLERVLRFRDAYRK
jgi:soluble lytic murein transglycosylase-like protein